MALNEREELELLELEREKSLGPVRAVPSRLGSGRGMYQDPAVLQKELASEYAMLDKAGDEDARQAHARNVIALRRALSNKNTESLPLDEENPDYVALLKMVERDALLRPEDAKTVPTDLLDRGGDAKPTALRAQTGDARKFEPKPLPMAKQRDDEADFGKQIDAWRAATGGVLKSGQNVRQAVAEWSGRQDPAGRRDSAQVEHLRETGELEGEEDSLAMQVGKPAAAMVGFGLGGPAGATAAEGAVRFATVASALHRAVQSGAVTDDEAAKILFDKLASGMGQDALFNFGVPFLAQIASRVPGAKWIAEKVGRLVEKAAASKAGQAVKGVVDDALIGAPDGAGVPRPSQRDVKLADRADLTDDPARKKAVEELGKRTKEIVPTQGQITGEATRAETLARKAEPTVFQKQEQQLAEAAEGMRNDVVNPGGQPAAKTLGERISSAAEDLVKKTKARLRPTFDAADDLGVAVDMSPVAKIAQDALKKDAAVPGGRLTAAERAHLESIVEGTKTWPTSSAEATLDFLSVQKEKMRSLNVDGKPSSFFQTVVGDLTKSADTAYSTAARAAGQGNVVRDLEMARKDYKGVMETVYDDAVKASLKKNPEDVGRLFWQSGNVSEIEQLHKMLDLAVKEKAVGGVYAEKMKRDVTRGFLQEAVRDVNAAATWSQTLKSDPLKRRTWEALTAGPGGAQLRSAMDVLENAAQIASHNTITLTGGQIIPLGRAQAGGAGVSYVTGTVHPGMMVVGLSLTGLTKAMATAYTQGNKGMLNTLAGALRANGVGTAASAKALQEALPKIEAWAAKNGIGEELFVGQQ